MQARSRIRRSVCAAWRIKTSTPSWPSIPCRMNFRGRRGYSAIAYASDTVAVCWKKMGCWSGTQSCPSGQVSRTCSTSACVLLCVGGVLVVFCCWFCLFLFVFLVLCCCFLLCGCFFLLCGFCLFF